MSSAPEPSDDSDHFVEEHAVARRLAGTQCYDATQLHRQYGPTGPLWLFTPRMDLYENLKINTVTATLEFPGTVTKENVQIEFENGQLIVSAETKTPSNWETNAYAVHETSSAKFQRALWLPPGLKMEDIKASMENGILTITYPSISSGVCKRDIVTISG
ncbi:HSP20-like chaperone [Cyathus striatus]|nr:HSP20-like chaperone [Cyathus striatus]